MISIPKAGGYYLLISATLVLIGWYTHWFALLSLMPGWATMKANTAACTLLAALAILRASRPGVRVHRDGVSIALISTICLIAIVSLSEDATGRSFGIDELLVRDGASRLAGRPPGRMSPATAFSLIFLSTGLLLVDYSVVSCVLCVAGVTVSVLGLVSLFYTAGMLAPVWPFSTFSLPSAIAFVTFGGATLILRRRQGVVALLRSSYADVAMTRPLFAGALLLPPGLGLLGLQGQKIFRYPAEFTLSLQTVGLMAGNSLLLWWISRIGWKVDRRRRQVERSLQVRTEELTKTKTALDQYAYVSIHELQEPLRIISLYSEMLGRSCQDRLGPEENEYVQVLNSSVRRMSHLVHDLRQYSQILATKGGPFRPVDMNEVLRRAMARCEDVILETKSVIKVGELPMVHGDVHQLITLFENLLDNAIKYRKPFSTPLIEVFAEVDEANYVFAVRDNGVGLRMQYAERIFGIFKRLHGHDMEGTGIGLAICQRVVEKHGGEIWVESELGVGSTFFLALPMLKPDTPPLAKATTAG